MWELHITVCVYECVCANICELSVDYSASFSPPPSLSSSPFFRLLLLLLLFLIHSHCYLLFFLNRSAALITQEWLVFSLKICVCVCLCVSECMCTKRQISAIESCLNTSVCGDRNRSPSPSRASKDMTHICLSLCFF